jgi:hypothetical protein
MVTVEQLLGLVERGLLAGDNTSRRALADVFNDFGRQDAARAFAAPGGVWVLLYERESEDDPGASWYGWAFSSERKAQEAMGQMLLQLLDEEDDEGGPRAALADQVRRAVAAGEHERARELFAQGGAPHQGPRAAGQSRPGHRPSLDVRLLRGAAAPGTKFTTQDRLPVAAGRGFVAPSPNSQGWTATMSTWPPNSHAGRSVLLGKHSAVLLG